MHIVDWFVSVQKSFDSDIVLLLTAKLWDIRRDSLHIVLLRVVQGCHCQSLP